MLNISRVDFTYIMAKEFAKVFHVSIRFIHGPFQFHNTSLNEFDEYYYYITTP